MKKVLTVFGTRPEVIKMAPIISKLKNNTFFDTTTLSVAQQRDMLDQALTTFNIKPDIDLNIMEPNQSLSQLSANMLLPIDQVLQEKTPDIVLAQGDTTTTLMVSLACFYQKIPFGHVEAGLRSKRFDQPFPEEMNRVLISRLATVHFAPTKTAIENLLNEGIANNVHLTGNTIIDAIAQMNTKQSAYTKGKRLILVTAHRRENFGQRLQNICRALRHLADTNQDIEILYPVHLNPCVSSVVQKELSDHPRIILANPLSYQDFVLKMNQSYLILTDSGGVQEEATFIGKPVLVLRDVTERGEGVEVGATKIVGTEFENIVAITQNLLDSEADQKKMLGKKDLYGDGFASDRIVDILANFR